MTAPRPRRDGSCFYEADPRLSLAQRAAAEAIGTFFLVFVVFSAGAVWSSRPDESAIARALSVGPALTGLILVFGQVSGGHYNPLISLSQWLGHRRTGACLVAYLIAQIAGASLAAKLAVLAFGGPASNTVAAPPISLALLAAEVFATAGLMMVVLATPRMRPAGVGPFAVGGWVAMTIVGLPHDPAANPAITVAALFISPGAFTVAFAHLLAQAVGLVLALCAISAAMPRSDPGVEREASNQAP